MTLPNTDAPIYLLVDPSPRYITYGTANLPGSLTISSVLNRAGTTNAIVQNTAAAQPGWSSNALNGTFLWETSPGAGSYPSSSAQQTSSSVGTPGFTFNGSAQFFEYDALASTFSGLGVGITVSCVVQLSGSASGTNVVWALSSASGTTALSLQYNAATGALSINTTNGSTAATVSGVGSTLCVVSATRNSSGVSLRVWTNVGTAPAGLPTLQTNSATVAAINETYTTFAVGAQVNTAGTGTNFFKGSVGQLAIYGVQSGTTTADIEEVEAEMLLNIGTSRLQDLATATAGGALEA